jgi:hypothetical protein
MLKYFAMLLFPLSCAAHEQTPTYPELKYSYVEGLSFTTINVFNRREDVKYFAIQVFDEEWKKIDFGGVSRVVFIDYLDKKDIDIYIKDQDRGRIKYVCTKSKLLKEDVKFQAVSSRICSKIK